MTGRVDRSSRRRVLAVACWGGLLAALAAIWVPFAGYIGASDVAVDRESVLVPLSAIEAGEFLVIDWHGQRLFVSREVEPIVVALSFERGAYLLPGVDGARCAVFGPIEGAFRCIDPETPRTLRERATWTLRGEPLGADLPPLRSPPHRIVGETLVIGDVAPR